ncbi:hypothetical protein CGCVW01_v001525, partial [Colletotrichum viniferum]
IFAGWSIEAATPGTAHCTTVGDSLTGPPGYLKPPLCGINAEATLDPQDSGLPNSISSCRRSLFSRNLTGSALRHKSICATLQHDNPCSGTGPSTPNKTTGQVPQLNPWLPHSERDTESLQTHPRFVRTAPANNVRQAPCPVPRVPRALRPCTTPRYGSVLQARRIVAFHSFLTSFLDPSRKPQFRASLGFPPPAQRAHVHTHVLQQANAAESNPPKTTVNQPCAEILASLLATRNCRRVSNTPRPNSPSELGYLCFTPSPTSDIPAQDHGSFNASVETPAPNPPNKKPPRYQLMTVRAMAQNRQPSGGYKQEPDNTRHSAICCDGES